MNNQHHNNQKTRTGPSSYNRQDPDLIFNEIGLKKGDTFLDLGCGAGDYTIKALDYIGSDGLVYALDQGASNIKSLIDFAHSQGIQNMKGIVTNILDPLPLDKGSVDVCLIATVLHTLNITKTASQVFTELSRVIKPGGRLFTIDLKKEETDFGPPLEMRLAPDELEFLVTNNGFKKLKFIDLGYFYLFHFMNQQE